MSDGLDLDAIEARHDWSANWHYRSLAAAQDSRNDVPALVAEVRRLRALCDVAVRLQEPQ